MITLPPRCHTVIASLHPAFAMHGMPQFRPMIAQTLRRGRTWAERDAPPARPTDLALLSTADDLAEYLAAAPKIVLDVETPRDNPTSITICGVSTRLGSAMVFPWTGEYVEVVREVLADPARIIVGHNFAYDYRALRAYGLEVRGFILDTIQAGALLWPPFKEAKKRRWSALTTYAARLLDNAPFWKHPEDATTRAFFRAAWPLVPDWLHPRLYCGLDCVYTGAIEPLIVELLRGEGMYETYVEYVAPAGRVLMDLEERGFAVDVEERERMKAAAEERLGELERKMAEFTAEKHERRLGAIRAAVADLRGQVEALVPTEPRCVGHPDYAGLTKRGKCEGCAGVYTAVEPARARIKAVTARVRKGEALLKRLGPTFRSDNDGHWRWLLFAEGGLRLKPVEYTAKRREPKVDDRAITLLQRRHPDIEVLQWREQIQGLLHRLRNVLSMELGKDARAHFSYSQHHTENMRIASGADEEEEDKPRASAGNGQNVKHEDRKLFVPSDPERMVLVKFDWSQVELYRVAWLAEDWELLEVIWRGEDIHSLNAAAIFGCTPDKAREHIVRFEGAFVDARYAAKRATHGWDYYMGVGLTAKFYGLSFKEATEKRAAYFRRWPRIQPWQERQIRRASEDGMLRNAFGYRLPFAGYAKNERTGKWEVADKAVAVAFEPASDVAFMCKAVLRPLNEIRVGDATLLNTEHDSFTFEVEEESVGALVAAARPILARKWPIFGERRGRLFAAGVDVEVGRNWGKYHKHGPKCVPSPEACAQEENREGLREWGG